MQRKALVDVNNIPTGEWFDPDAADSFDERYDWDGSNNISRATRSQFAHQTLYKTHRGTWIMKESSQYESTLTTYREISPAAAAEWFARNEYSDVPEELLEFMAEKEK